MKRINPIKAALSLAMVLGIYHLTWVALVAAGLAKPFLDFVLRLHFIQMNYKLAPFDASTAAMLVALTFTIGAAFGLIFAFVWNGLTDRAAVTSDKAQQAE
jgi:hypothetical protein